METDERYNSLSGDTDKISLDRVSDADELVPRRQSDLRLLCDETHGRLYISPPDIYPSEEQSESYGEKENRNSIFGKIPVEIHLIIARFLLSNRRDPEIDDPRFAPKPLQKKPLTYPSVIYDSVCDCLSYARCCASVYRSLVRNRKGNCDGNISYFQIGDYDTWLVLKKFKGDALGFFNNTNNSSGASEYVINVDNSPVRPNYGLDEAEKQWKYFQLVWTNKHFKNVLLGLPVDYELSSKLEQPDGKYLDLMIASIIPHWFSEQIFGGEEVFIVNEIIRLTAKTKKLQKPVYVRLIESAVLERSPRLLKHLFQNWNLAHKFCACGLYHDTLLTSPDLKLEELKDLDFVPLSQTYQTVVFSGAAQLKNLDIFRELVYLHLESANYKGDKTLSEYWHGPSTTRLTDIIENPKFLSFPSPQTIFHSLILNLAPIESLMLFLDNFIAEISVKLAVPVCITTPNLQALDWLKKEHHALPWSKQEMQRMREEDPDRADWEDSWILLASEPRVLRLLLESGYDPDVSEGRRLRTAASRNDVPTVRLLLEFDANPHVNDDGPLIYACSTGNAEIVRLLLQHGADLHNNDELALLTAVTYGHYDCVVELVKYGANIMCREGEIIRIARRKANRRILDLFSRHCETDSVDGGTPTSPTEIGTGSGLRSQQIRDNINSFQ